MRIWIFCLLFALPGCDFGHLGNPLLLPARAVGAGLDNAAYNAERRKVRAYLAANRDGLLAGTAPGPAWAGLKVVARTRPDREAQMLRDFIAIRHLPDPQWLDQATVIAMVMGDF